MMKKTSYIDKYYDWANQLQGKYLLFDTSAIINILEYGGRDLMEKLKKSEVGLSTIEPVYVELLATDSDAKRVERQSFIQEFEFQILPITKANFENSRILQAELRLKRCYPSPTDLYLGSILNSYSSSGMVLITCDHKDFPEPVYSRDGHIILYSDKSVTVLLILSKITRITKFTLTHKD